MNFKHVCSYKRAKNLFLIGVKPNYSIGSFVYGIHDEHLYVILDILEGDKLSIYNFKMGKIVVQLKNDLYKAYTGSEIGDLLPVEFTLPKQFIEADEKFWAFCDDAGDILTDANYPSETEARASYLLFFLKHKIIKVENLDYGKD